MDLDAGATKVVFDRSAMNIEVASQLIDRVSLGVKGNELPYLIEVESKVSFLGNVPFGRIVGVEARTVSIRSLS